MPRRRLVIRLIEEAHLAKRDERENTIVARPEAIRATSGVLTGAYEEGYLERLSEDWPE
jgi:hypothetical protein